MVLGCVHAPVTSFTDAHRSSVSPEVCVCSKCNCNVCFSCYVSRLQSGFSVLLMDVHRQGLCLLDVPFHGLLFSFWHFFGVEAFSVPGLRDFFFPMRILVQGLLCRTFTFLGCCACCEQRGGLFIASFSSRVCSVEPLHFLDAAHVVNREEDCLSPHSIFSQSPERHFRSKLRRSLKGTRHRRPFPRTQGKMGSYSETLLIPRVYYLSSNNLLHQDL